MGTRLVQRILLYLINSYFQLSKAAISFAVITIPRHTIPDALEVVVEVGVVDWLFSTGDSDMLNLRTDLHGKMHFKCVYPPHEE